MSWTNITSFVKKVSLTLSEKDVVVSSSLYNVFDAMNATELNNSKMDHMYDIFNSDNDNNQDNSNKNNHENVLNVIENENFLSLFSKNTNVITNQQIIILLNKNLRLFSSYLNSASIFESTHKCILLWPESWKVILNCKSLDIIKDNLIENINNNMNNNQKITIIYSLITNIMMRTINHMIMMADQFEEEDFQPISTTQSEEFFANENIDLNILQEIKIEIIDDNDKDNKDVNKQMKQILQVYDSFSKVIQGTYDWIQFCLDLSNNEMNTNTNNTNNCTSNVSDSDNSNDSYINKVKSKMIILRPYIATCLGEIKKMKEMNISTNNKNIPEEDNKIVNQFYSEILPKFHQSGPFKTVPNMTSDDALDVLKDICDDLDYCIISASMVTSFENCIHIASEVSRSRTSLLPRSILWVFMNRILVMESSRNEIIDSSFKYNGFPESLLKYDVITVWKERMTNALFKTMKGLLASRYRCQTAIHNVLPEWESVLKDGYNLDVQYSEYIKTPEESTSASTSTATSSKNNNNDHQMWCQCWALNFILMLIDIQFSVIMEADVLITAEMDFMLWYWAEILQTRLQVLSVLRTNRHAYERNIWDKCMNDAQTILSDYFTNQVVTSDTSSSNKNSNSKKKKNKGKNKSKSNGLADSEPIEDENVREAKEWLDNPPPRPELSYPGYEELLINSRVYLYKSLSLQFRVLNMTIIKNSNDSTPTTEDYLLNWNARMKRRIEPYLAYRMWNPALNLDVSSYLKKIDDLSAELANADLLSISDLMCAKTNQIVDKIRKEKMYKITSTSVWVDERENRGVPMLGKELQGLRRCIIAAKINMTSLTKIQKQQVVQQLQQQEGKETSSSQYELIINASHSKVFPLPTLKKKE